MESLAELLQVSACCQGGHDVGEDERDQPRVVAAVASLEAATVPV